MKSTRPVTFVLVDGNALIHRAFHAFPLTLKTRSGQIINAAYGFTLLLLNTIKDVEPTHVAVAFDLPKPTFRHEEFSDYKAHREKPDDALIEQFPIAHTIVESLNIPIFEREGFEADDVIGTLSREAIDLALRQNLSLRILILTGDRDALQLVDDYTHVITPKHGSSDVQEWDRVAVEKSFGLRPAQLIDYKALRGDPSDNIPGVSGIGEKTATTLLQAAETLDGLYRAVDNAGVEAKEIDINGTKIKGRVLENLRNEKDIAYLSKRLATIVRDIPIGFDWSVAELADYDRAKAETLFAQLEFRTLVGRLPHSRHDGPSVPPQLSTIELVTPTQPITVSDTGDIVYSDEWFISEAKRRHYKDVRSLEELDEILATWNKEKEIVLDTETDSLDIVSTNLVGISLGLPGKERSYYLPVGHRHDVRTTQQHQLAPNQLPLASVIDRLNTALNGKTIIGHNIKFDWQVLLRHGLKIVPGFDTMLASYILTSGTRQHNLADVASLHLQRKVTPIEILIGKGKKQVSFADVPVFKAATYSCEDVDVTRSLASTFRAAFKGQKALHDIFSKLEVPLVPILGQMELNGILVDVDRLKALSVTTRREIATLEKKISTEAGEEFNISSPQQVSRILFEKLKLSTDDLKKTKITKSISTAAGELEKLRDAHPIVPLILDHRERSKLLGTYIDALPALVHAKTGRVHTSFNQTVTATGRLSSSTPNLQNIPATSELGRAIRGAFIAKRGHRLVSFDYSQIELRLVAHLSKDQALLEDFRNGRDIHAATAARINGVSIDAVTKDMRSAAKAVNFGILYGMSAHGLSQAIGIPRDEAKFFIDRYFQIHRSVWEMLEEIKVRARADGYAETFMGRRRLIPEIRSTNYNLRAAGERMAINMPFQGTAADLLKKAMIDIMHAHPELASRLLLQVHDELVFELPTGDVAAWAKKIVPLMESALKVSVPLVVNVKAGQNWQDQTPVD